MVVLNVVGKYLHTHQHSIKQQLIIKKITPRRRDAIRPALENIGRVIADRGARQVSFKQEISITDMGHVCNKVICCGRRIMEVVCVMREAVGAYTHFPHDSKHRSNYSSGDANLHDTLCILIYSSCKSA